MATLVLDVVLDSDGADVTTVVITMPPLVTVIGVGVGMVDVDDVALEGVEVELLDEAVVLLIVVELLVVAEDEAEVVAEDVVVIEAAVEVEVGVEEVLAVVGAVVVVGAAGVAVGALLEAIGIGVGTVRDIAGPVNANEQTLKKI